MPTKDDPRVTVRLSPELDRVLSRAAIQARRGSKAHVIRELLERTYLEDGAVEQASGGTRTLRPGESTGRPAPAEPSDRYRCPRDCDPSFRPPSALAPCRVCGRRCSVTA